MKCAAWLGTWIAQSELYAINRQRYNVAALVAIVAQSPLCFAKSLLITWTLCSF